MSKASKLYRVLKLSAKAYFVYVIASTITGVVRHRKARRPAQA